MTALYAPANDVRPFRPWAGGALDVLVGTSLLLCALAGVAVILLLIIPCEAVRAAMRRRG